MLRIFALTAAVLACALGASAETYPTATISNGEIEAKLYLPDAEHGSYRGTRFDWSGIISSLKWNGHEYFGQWYAKHDPLVHDAITGPVDVYETRGAALGYDEARRGEGFLRIGVGVLEKPDEPAYRGTYTYKILDPGTRTVERKQNAITFTHDVAGPNGYGYSYTKTISLTPDQPEMVISYSLKNTGSKTIETSVYNHGFFQLDGEPAGPSIVWTFPWVPTTTSPGIAEINGKHITYSREIRDGERLMAVLTGYGQTASDHSYTVENRKSGAGVRVTADQPVAKLTFWSRRLAYAPEVLVQLVIPPGATKTWRTRYNFYSNKGKR